MTPAEIEPATFRFVAQCLNHCATARPDLYLYLNFIHGSENWTLTALEGRRIEAAEMKLLRPLAGYTLYDHKTNDPIRHELQITCILDKIEEYRLNRFLHLQKFHKSESP
jgi:hypothetical protein